MAFEKLTLFELDIETLRTQIGGSTRADDEELESRDVERETDHTADTMPESEAVGMERPSRRGRLLPMVAIGLTLVIGALGLVRRRRSNAELDVQMDTEEEEMESSDLDVETLAEN